jgi:hypothetical protein
MVLNKCVTRDKQRVRDFLSPPRWDIGNYWANPASSVITVAQHTGAGHINTYEVVSV